MAAAALAQGDGERVGENVGELLGGWAKSLYVGIAAVVALMFLLNRRFADLAVFMVAALVVGGFVMAPERRRGHGARHLADDHGLMAERVVIRSYRRVFEVDRRIYRVDRWALPVPGGVPLRAVGYFAATVLAMIVLGRAARVGELVGRAVAAAALRGRAAGGRGARHAGGAGRPRGASVRVGLAAAAGAGAAAVRPAAWCALEGEPVALGRRAGGALGRRRRAAASRARARAGAGDVQRAGRAARGRGRLSRGRRRGRAVRWCCAAGTVLEVRP